MCPSQYDIQNNILPKIDGRFLCEKSEYIKEIISAKSKSDIKIRCYPESTASYLDTNSFVHVFTKQPVGFLFLQCSRQEQIILTRFWSGDLRTLTFRDGNKVFPTCVRCSACQASPEHILDCQGLSKQDLYEDPLMVLDFLRVNEIMDLVQPSYTRAFGDGPRHFEPWSSDQDDTGAGTPSPNNHTTSTGGRLSSRQI
ncbi:uncharacterized protein TNCV_3071941 [Trichonephila clavipes]|nr:uncharacterized protein TNCV_3071941 [Trichonephila clavipes]